MSMGVRYAEAFMRKCQNAGLTFTDLSLNYDGKKWRAEIVVAKEGQHYNSGLYSDSDFDKAIINAIQKLEGESNGPRNTDHREEAVSVLREDSQVQSEVQLRRSPEPDREPRQHQ